MNNGNHTVLAAHTIVVLVIVAAVTALLAAGHLNDAAATSIFGTALGFALGRAPTSGKNNNVS